MDVSKKFQYEYTYLSNTLYVFVQTIRLKKCKNYTKSVLKRTFDRILFFPLLETCHCKNEHRIHLFDELGFLTRFIFRLSFCHHFYTMSTFQTQLKTLLYHSP